jgi:hypothetical protein
MRKRLSKIYFLLFLTLFSDIVFCQDSLYLIGTITGESNAKRITDVKGIGDVNGDGYDDFMVSTVDQMVRLYLGSTNFNLTPSVIFHYPGKDTFYGFGGCAGIGDVNGDGYNDFIIKGNFYDWGCEKGKVFLYFGGSEIDTISKYEFYEPWIQDWFGWDVEGVGDINKDGYNDFIISSLYNWTDGKGRAYLFYGGDTISFARSITFIDTLAIIKKSDSFLGRSVANIGDVNRDGFDDIAISAGNSLAPEKVYIYYGETTMNNIPDTVITSNDLDDSFGRIIKRAGDLNKDGVADFCIASGGNIYLYIGRDSLIIVNAYALGFGGGVGLETNCDINNDGYNDYIIGNTNYRNSDNVMVGGAFVYLGGEIIDTVYKYKLEGENKWDEFSRIITTADVNGDGYDELFIMAPNYPDYNNPLGKVYIYSYKKLTDVKENKKIAPYKFDLYQNYPNPFNPNTVISYQLSVVSNVSLKVYDILGREVATLVDGMKETGYYSVTFDGSRLASGVYFVRLTAQPADGSTLVSRTMKILMTK